MTAGLSSDLDSFKEVLWQTVLSLDESNEAGLRTIRALEAKRNEPIPQAAHPSLQVELDKIYAVYQQWKKTVIVVAFFSHDKTDQLMTALGSSS